VKILVVGTGSIGTRHIKNLYELGHEIFAVDTNVENLKQVLSLTKNSYNSLEEALKGKPDAAFICTYSNDHMRPALKCAEAGCHLFIEKPLSTSLEGIQELLDIAESKKLITMVGCNMRFHPAVSYIHKQIKSNRYFTKPLWGNFETGYFLPFDKEDYQKSYKANRSMGGNLILDAIHELDYAIWFLGEPQEVICSKGIISSLKIDTEDHVEMIVKFRSGAVCTMHMDYLQHGYSRRCKIVCEEGTVVWDFVGGSIGSVTVQDGKWAWKDMKVDISYNQMYIDEARYFMDCVSAGRATFNSIRESMQSLKLALAADRSSSTNQWEKV